MERIFLKACAKLNLFLDITGKRGDGYHLIKSVMQSVDIFDFISVTKSYGISVKCSISELDGESNLAYKAAKLFFEQTGINGGAEIYIEKRIPMQSGMAGGSADAAAALYALNALYETGLSEEELCALGAKLGADVPFSLSGGTTLCEGIGEQLASLTELPDCFFVIIKPKSGMSTAESYKIYDEHEAAGIEHGDFSAMSTALGAEDISGVGKALYNALEVAVPPGVLKIKEELLDAGAAGALMTGSGTAVFGIFDNIEAAVKAKSALSDKYENIFIARPAKSGVSFDESAPVFERLDSLGIKYEHIEHPSVFTMDEMYALGVFNKGIVGKNLFLRDAKGKRHFLVFVYGDKRVSLSDIQEKLNISRCSFASAERLYKYLRLTKGSVSPLGVINDKNAAVEFIIDKDFIGCPCVGVHPNRNTATLWMTFDDLLKVIKDNGNSISFAEI